MLSSPLFLPGAFQIFKMCFASLICARDAVEMELGYNTLNYGWTVNFLRTNMKIWRVFFSVWIPTSALAACHLG